MVSQRENSKKSFAEIADVLKIIKTVLPQNVANRNTTAADNLANIPFPKTEISFK